MAFTSAPLPPLGILFANTSSDAGQFAVNGQSVNLLAGRKLVAAYGSFSLTGQDATLTEGGAQTAVNAAPLPPLTFLTLASSGNYVLVAEWGAFAENGQDAALRNGRGLVAECGTFSASGAPAQRDMEMNGDYRQFTVSGQEATLSAVRKLTCECGSFLAAGQSSSGVLETPIGKRMPADFGTFYLNTNTFGQPTAGDASYVRGYKITAEHGTFTVGGQAADLDGPIWRDVADSSGTWVYVTPSGGVWTDVDPDS